MKQAALADQDAPAILEDVLLRNFPGWRVAHWCVVVFAVSFLVMALLPEARLTDFEVPNAAEPVRVARSLAADGTFANPFASLPTGSTAHVAPVYPFLYSLVLRGLGTGHAALQVMWALNLGLLALQMALLPLLSHRLKFGVLPGIIAAGSGTFSLHAPVDTRWECFLAGALLLLAFLGSERSLAHGKVYWSCAIGVLWGILILTQPVMVPLLAAWLLCSFAFAASGGRPKIASRSALIVAVALVTVSPWIVRNYVRFGTFIFVRDCLGLDLYTSNYPCVAPTLQETMRSGCHARTNPNTSRDVSAQLLAAGEPQYNSTRLHAALAWIDHNRGRFLALTFRRFRLFWFPDLERQWEAVLVWGVTVLSFVGIRLMGKKSRVASALIITAWLVFPLIYYVSTYDPRYRYPIYWTSLLPAGYAAGEVGRRFAFRRVRR